MAIIKWDPFRDISGIQDHINKVFEESFPRIRIKDRDNPNLYAWEPPVDIFETDTDVVIQAEIPGVHKEDVSVEVKDNILIIKGDRLPDEKSGERNYYRQERCFGTFQRAFALQDFVDTDKIGAHFSNGVLEVTIPKPEEEIPVKIRVEADEEE